MGKPKYESYRSIRKGKKKEKSYGETLFKVLFYILFTLGVVVTLFGFFVEEYFNLMIPIGINTILFSFAYKFMESVISLLKKISEE